MIFDGMLSFAKRAEEGYTAAKIIRSYTTELIRENIVAALQKIRYSAKDSQDDISETSCKGT